MRAAIAAMLMVVVAHALRTWALLALVLLLAAVGVAVAPKMALTAALRVVPMLAEARVEEVTVEAPDQKAGSHCCSRTGKEHSPHS